MDNFSEIKKQMQRSEENLTSFACLSSDAIREKVKRRYKAGIWKRCR